MIEIRHEVASASVDAVLIHCSADDAAVGVGRCLELALQLGHTQLVVDLGDRRGADAELLDVLLRAGHRFRAAGGRLAVVCADSRLRRLFDMTLLSRGFGVYATREEAFAG